MSRLIDADALWMEVIHTMDYCDDILEIIEHQKTIEPTHLNDSNTLETLDCIGRQEAIDAMYALVDGCERNDPYKENPHIDAIIDTLENLPSAQPETPCYLGSPCEYQNPDAKMPPAQPTLYGYKIEHLACIAMVMEKEGVTADYAVRTFDDMSRMIKMIIEEAQQKVEEILNG